MIGVGLSIVQLAVRQMLGGAFTPASLFANSEPGVWYDPSDLTTLFQDSAGTTPVTAVEQPVGKMLDKSGRGFHATQTTSTSRPVLSARYNLLTKTEQFADAAWTKTGSTTIQSNVAIAPDGTTTADELTLGASGAVRQIVPVVASSTHVWFKAAASGSATHIRISTNNALAWGTGYGTKVALTSEWQRISAAGAVTGNTSTSLSIGVLIPTDGSNDPDCYGKVLIWGASLVPANQASLPYQRVNTATDYDTVGFPSGENFDGSDDYQTASSGGGSTSAFFWCSAIMVRKVGSTQTLFSDTGTNTGYRVRINASNQLELSAGNGSAYTTVATTATLSYGQIAVLTAWHDGTNLNVQIDDGTVHQTAFATASAGTASLTIGRDNGAASSYAGIRLFEKVYLKNLVPSAGDIAKTKTYVGATAGMTI